MAMTMHNGLAGSSSDVETDIITSGLFCFLDHPLTVAHKFEYRIFFLAGQGKKSCTWRKGITSICPLDTGFRSQRA